MHDYFEILGVGRNARPTEIRRACCRRVHVTHPDIRDGDPAPAGPARSAHRLDDAAIDFVDAATFVEAMRLSFFASPARRDQDDSFF